MNKLRQGEPAGVLAFFPQDFHICENFSFITSLWTSIKFWLEKFSGEKEKLWKWAHFLEKFKRISHIYGIASEEIYKYKSTSRIKSFGRKCVGKKVSSALLLSSGIIMPYLEYHTKTNRMKETGKVHDYYSDFRVRWFRRKNPCIQHRESKSFVRFHNYKVLRADSIWWWNVCP